MLRAVRDSLGPAVIAVLADHGENLGEHRDDGHGLFLYESVIRVPFVISVPGREGRIVENVARNVDLAPTLCVLAGLRDVAFPYGTDLLAPGPAPARPLFAETLAPTQFPGGAALQSLRSGRWKVILAPRPELYDLERDPRELDDLSGSNGETARGLLGELTAYAGEVMQGPREERARGIAPDAQQREALDALGYLVSDEPASAGSEPSPRGIDPKDLVDVFWAQRYIDDGLLEEARPRLARFWREHPAPPDTTWNGLFARAYYCQAAVDWLDGRLAAAREHCDRSIALDPSFEDARLLRDGILR